MTKSVAPEYSFVVYLSRGCRHDTVTVILR